MSMNANQKKQLHEISYVHNFIKASLMHLLHNLRVMPPSLEVRTVR